jgi:hypothetical protein
VHVIIDRPPLPKAESSSQKQASPEKPLPQFERPEWVIVYITAAYALISLLMFLAIRRQANTMEKQAADARTSAAEAAVVAQSTLNAIEQQNINLRRQVIWLRMSAKAAKVGAEAANLSAKAAMMNAQAATNAERAWIVMEFLEQDPTTFKLVATNYGRSPAQVIGYNIQQSANMSEADLHPTPPEFKASLYSQPQSQPFLVPEEEWTVIDKLLVIPPNMTVSGPDMPQQPRMCWGVVRYRDIIGNAEHDTWFCQRYDARSGEFVLTGPEGYNRYS